MARSNIMHCTIYDDNSRTTKSSSTTDDNPVTLPVEWHWPDDLQPEPEFPHSKHLHPFAIVGIEKINNYENIPECCSVYELTDGAIIQGKVIPIKMLWHSKDKLEVQFDAVTWEILKPPHEQSESDMSRPNQLRHIQAKRCIEPDNIYKTNAGQQIVVNLKVVKFEDQYDETGLHSYNISYIIDIPRATPSTCISGIS